MEKTLFLVVSACIALVVSNPIPEPQLIGDVIGIVSDGREQFFMLQQQPAEFFVVESMSPEKKKDVSTMADDENDNQEKQPEEQERSFFFKKWFGGFGAAPVAAVSVVQQPQMIRLPQPVLLGTVYQPISLVTTPVLPGLVSTSGISTNKFAGLVGQQGISSGISSQQLSGLLGQKGISSGISSQQLAGLLGQQMMTTGTRPAVEEISRPQPSVSLPSVPSGSVDINIQQIMRPESGLRPQGIMTSMCGPLPCTGSAASTNSASGSGSSTGIAGLETNVQGLGEQGTGHATGEHGNIAVGTGTHGHGTSETIQGSLKVPRPRPQISGGSINFEKIIDVMGQIGKS